jgi:hypothetical protein
MPDAEGPVVQASSLPVNPVSGPANPAASPRGPTKGAGQRMQVGHRSAGSTPSSGWMSADPAAGMTAATSAAPRVMSQVPETEMRRSPSQ